jgi:hypothetical protein
MMLRASVPIPKFVSLRRSPFTNIGIERTLGSEPINLPGAPLARVADQILRPCDLTRCATRRHRGLFQRSIAAE